MILQTDRLRGAARGTPAQALSRVDGPDAKDRAFVQAIYRLAPEVFIDPAIAIAQVGHETGGLTSSRWNRDLNPAGVGIVSDATAQPFHIPTAEVAAQLYVSMLNRLVIGRRDESWQPAMPPQVNTWLDTVWARHCQFAPAVSTINDLNVPYRYPDGDSSFTWAEDPDYEAGVERWGKTLYPFLIAQSDKTSNDVVFGRVPRPNIRDMIVQKAGPGAGYTALSEPRWLVGGCEHITDGLGDVQFYAEFFGINGERADDALVDFVIDRSGAIAMLNDPWGFRSPYANGGLDGLEGDGPAFLARFGVEGVNNQLWSTEHEGRAADDWTDAEQHSTIELDAYMFDSVGIRWDSYPVHQDYGIVTHLDHSEFTGKGGNTEDECAGRFFHRNVTRIQAAVRGRMKQFQTGSVTGGDVGPQSPIQGGRVFPKGLTEAEVAKNFGKLLMHHGDGSSSEHRFAINGPISMAWLARAEKENVLPAATDSWELVDKRGIARKVVGFKNGWTLVSDPTKPRAGWVWAT